LFFVYRYLPWKAASEQLGNNSLGKVGVFLASLVVIPYYFKIPWIFRGWAKLCASGKLQLVDLSPDIRADYIKRAPVLDAWVARHSARAREAHESVIGQISKDSIYVPMPVSVRGKRLQIPTREDFGWLAGPQSVVLSITGPGGSGKSIFAAELGLWALEGLGKGGQEPIIPVFIRLPTTDLVATTQEILRPMVDYDEDLDTALIVSLISRKRLLIVIDSLSEWNEAARSYFEQIRGKMAIGALATTSRRPVNLSGAIQISLQGLDTGSMFLFREKYVKQLNVPVKPDFEAALDHGLVDMKTKWFDEAEPTCLLVRMYIDDAVANATPATTNLASNAPDVVVRYVQRLSALRGDRIGENPDTAHLYLHRVANLHPERRVSTCTHASGCSTDDYVSGLQGAYS